MTTIKQIPVEHLHRTPVRLRGRVLPTLADQAAIISAQLKRAARAEKRGRIAARGA